MSSVYKRLILLSGSLLLALYLLLVVDLAAFHSRALNALWNRAHVGLFVMLTFAFDYTLLRRYPRRALLWSLMLSIPLVLFALITEGLQTLTQRQASVEDVWWDIIGIALAMSLIAAWRFSHNTRQKVFFTGIALALFTATVFSPLMLALADWRNEKDFPLLSNMERFSDHYLWSRGEISDEHAKAGTHALKVALKAELYSGTTLRHMPGDWTQFESLHLSVFNPNADILPLSLRVQDSVHDHSEQVHSDRFNHDFNAKPGWTDLVIPLQKIEKAPRARAMRMNAITRLRIYARDDKHAGSAFYIDEVYLSPPPPLTKQ